MPDPIPPHSIPSLSLNAFMPFRLSFTSNLVSGRIARAYAALFGLSIPEWRLVTVIAESAGISQAAIGQRTRMDKVTVSRAAIALAGRGLLTRTANPADGRSHLLALSEAGRDLYAQVVPEALALERRITDALGGDEAAAFVATLRRIDSIVLALEDGE